MGKGFDLELVTLDVLTENVIINTGLLNQNYSFDGSPTGSNIRLAPPDDFPNIYEPFEFCLGGINSNLQNPQQILVTYFVPGPDGEPIEICADTLSFNCPPTNPSGDSCLVIKNDSIICDSNAPGLYCYSFQVQNLSSFTAQQIVLNSNDPDIKFLPCNPLPFHTPMPTQALDINPGVEQNECSDSLCVKIVSTNTIIQPTEFCFTAGIFDSGNCCNSPVEFCVTLLPCCDPCEDVQVFTTPLPDDDGTCCHSLSIDNNCVVNLFTKVEIVSGTPGVTIGSSFIGGSNPGDWTNPKSNSQCVQWAHSSGVIPSGLIDNVINFCLDDINANETPQVIHVNWIGTSSIGSDSTYCSDSIIYDCRPIDTTCVTIIDVVAKGNLCDTINCYEEPFCAPWVRDLILNNSGCTGLYLESIEKGIWNNQQILIFNSSSVPDAYYNIVYNCHGDTLQSCFGSISGEVCTPDLGTVDIFNSATNVLTVWNCGDPLPPLDPSCNTTSSYLDFCVTIENSAYPVHDATELIILPIDPTVLIYPSPYQLQLLSPGQTATLDLTVYGNINPGDTIKFEIRLHDGVNDDNWCCSESDTLCLVIPPCDQDDCCIGYTEFDLENDINQILQSLTINDCEVCIDTSFLGSCTQLIIDWGDQSLQSQTINNKLCHEYLNGVYDLCLSAKIINDTSGLPCLVKDTCIRISIDCGSSTCGTCVNGILQNPSFELNAVGGNLGSVGNTDDWFVAYGSPQINTNDGCDQNTSLQMWGNQDVGEATQIAVNIIEGNCYDLSFCARFLDQQNLPTKYVRFEFYASSGPATSFGCSTCTLIGTSTKINAISWNCYVLPTWTADANYNYLIVKATNDVPDNNTSTTVSWGRIDDICFTEADCQNTCCIDQDDFNHQVDAGVLFQTDCEFVCFTPNLLDDCDSLFIDWGDGTVDVGTGNQTICHNFSAPGNYSLCIKVNRYSDNGGLPCLSKTVCYPINIPDCTCDNLNASIIADTSSVGDCCYWLTIQNNYSNNVVSGILLSVNNPAIFSQIQVSGGWTLSFTSSLAILTPPTGYLNMGTHNNVARICTDNYANSVHTIDLEWLTQINSNTVSICEEELELTCPVSSMSDRCVIVVQDSIDCLTESYCIKVTNNSSPQFGINKISLSNIHPLGTIITPSVIDIPLLSYGATSDWICVNYYGLNIIDTLCFNVSGHFEDANGHILTCCTDTVMHCTPIDCTPPPPVFSCDSLQVDYSKDVNSSDSCCYLLSITNNYIDQYWKGIQIEVPPPSIISNINALNGWQISNFNGSHLELIPPNGFIGIGHQVDIARICNEGYVSNPHDVILTWLYEENGVCKESCPDTLQFSCSDTNDNCVIITDSFDCNTNKYCVKITNTTSPNFDIGSLQLINIDPVQVSFNPNPIILLNSISFGESTDWICLDVPGSQIGQDICYSVVAHLEDISVDSLPTWCCTDTIQHCFTKPSCIPCDSLTVSVTPDNNSDSCSFDISIYNGFSPVDYIGIHLEINTSGVYFGNVQSQPPHWDLEIINAASYNFYYLDVFDNSIPLGNHDLGQFCLTGQGVFPQDLTFGWIEVDENGDTLITCVDEGMVYCDPVPEVMPCLNVFDDSLYCDSNGDHYIEFKISNHTHLLSGGSIGFDFLSYNISLYSSSGNATLNPIIASLSNQLPFPLEPGDSTTTRLRHRIEGGVSGEQICFSITGHDMDIPNHYTNCCTADTVWCFTLPLCPSDGSCGDFGLILNNTDSTVCCHSFDLVNNSSTNLTSVTMRSLTQNLILDSYSDQDWMINNSFDSSEVKMTYINSPVPMGLTSNAIDLCISNIFDVSQTPPVIEISWAATVGGFDSLLCVDTIVLPCNLNATPCDPTYIKIPNGLSPDNGDGINQTLKLINPSGCVGVHLEVYNRWGQKVWEKQNYDNSWDGRSKLGEALPDGTYYLILRFENDKKARLSTFLDLRRQ